MNENKKFKHIDYILVLCRTKRQYFKNYMLKSFNSLLDKLSLKIVSKGESDLGLSISRD